MCFSLLNILLVPSRTLLLWLIVYIKQSLAAANYDYEGQGGNILVKCLNVCFVLEDSDWAEEDQYVWGILRRTNNTNNNMDSFTISTPNFDKKKRGGIVKKYIWNSGDDLDQYIGLLAKTLIQKLSQK